MNNIALFIFKSIVELSIAATVCIVLIQLFEWLLSKTSVRFKYLLWCIVIIRLWIPLTIISVGFIKGDNSNSPSIPGTSFTG